MRTKYISSRNILFFNILLSFFLTIGFVNAQTITIEKAATISWTDIGANIKALRSGSSQWGDYDNDGDLDLLITGRDKSVTYYSKIYENQNNTFVDIYASIDRVAYGNTSWGDYDNDGDLDILLCGWDGNDDLLQVLWEDHLGEIRLV